MEDFTRLGIELFRTATDIINILPLDGIFGSVKELIGAPGIVTLLIFGWLFN